jgi:hypothetical protein
MGGAGFLVCEVGAALAKSAARANESKLMSSGRDNNEVENFLLSLGKKPLQGRPAVQRAAIREEDRVVLADNSRGARLEASLAHHRLRRLRDDHRP